MRFLLPAGALAIAGLTACDGRTALMPEPNPDYPGVVDLGEVAVLQPSDIKGDSVYEMATYEILGPPEVGQRGGASASFIGTGGSVCVIVDPEAVYWSESVSIIDNKEKWAYPDNYLDDGDIDLEVGLSANYTGSPGIEIGDFEAVYEDSLGTESYIEFNECAIGGYLGQTDAHSGRGTVESCTIDTSGRAGKEYTVVLNTWSVPFDDFLLSYAFAVVEGDCGSIGALDECALPNESLSETFGALEAAFCDGEQYTFCTNNPTLCGTDLH